MSKLRIVALTAGLTIVVVLVATNGYLLQGLVFAGAYLVKSYFVKKGLLTIFLMGMKKLITKWVFNGLVSIGVFFASSWRMALIKNRVAELRTRFFDWLRKQHPILYVLYTMAVVLTVGVIVWSVMLFLGVMRPVIWALDLMVSIISRELIKYAFGRAILRALRTVRMRAERWHTRMLRWRELYRVTLVRALRRAHRKLNRERREKKQ